MTNPDTVPVIDVSSVTKHFPLGPSKSDKVVPCPGFLTESSKWPETPSGPAAIDGTHSHSLLEHCLSGSSVPMGITNPSIYFGCAFRDQEGEFVVHQDRIDRVKVATQYVQSYLESSPDAKLLVEEFVDIGSIYDIPGWGGTADLIIIDAATLCVMDYKDGHRVIAPDAWQLVDYTLGVYNSLTHLQQINITDIVMGIIQPRDMADPIKTKRLPIAEFLILADETILAHQKQYNDIFGPVAGPHCEHYCPAAKPGRCEAYNGLIVDTVNQGFAMVPQQNPGSLIPATRALQMPPVGEALSEQFISEALNAKPLIIAWLTAIEEEGLTRFQAGHVIPGRKVIRGQTCRKFALKDVELAAKFKSMGIPKSDYLREAVRTPKQILALDRVKKWSKTKIKHLQDLIIKPQGALKLVPSTDPGTAVLFDVNEGFAAVPTAEEHVGLEAPRTITTPAASTGQQEVTPGKQPETKTPTVQTKPLSFL